MDDTYLNTLWEFVRGDLAVPEFEAWLYSHDDVEAALGSTLYLEVISADYRSSYEIFDVREKLRSILPAPLDCLCITLPNLAIIPMGGDGLDRQFFATVREVQRYGRELWWLQLERCSACGQNWLVAQEERIYDDYMLKRLNADEAGNIVDKDRWPDDFRTYEAVLEVGKQLSNAYRFADPMSPTLIHTIQELKLSRPKITEQEVAELLGITPEHVAALTKRMTSIG